MSSRQAQRGRVEALETFVAAWDEFVVAGHRLELAKAAPIFSRGHEIAAAGGVFEDARTTVVEARRRIGPVRVSPEPKDGISVPRVAETGV